MYMIPYQAEFKCPKDHKFTERVEAFAKDEMITCKICFREWVENNIPKAHQISEAVIAEERFK